jgi:hypothetical protein
MKARKKAAKAEAKRRKAAQKKARKLALKLAKKAARLQEKAYKRSKAYRAVKTTKLSGKIARALVFGVEVAYAVKQKRDARAAQAAETNEKI